MNILTSRNPTRGRGKPTNMKATSRPRGHEGRKDNKMKNKLMKVLAGISTIFLMIGLSSLDSDSVIPFIVTAVSSFILSCLGFANDWFRR